MAREPVRQHDWVSCTLSTLLSVAIDAHPKTFAIGDALPPGHHWLLCPSLCTESELSEDGYTQEHAPPLPYNRRVWAGGQLQWRKPVIMGNQMHSCTRALDASVRGKDDKLFVQIEKLYSPSDSPSDWNLRELRTLAYMKSSSLLDQSWKRTPGRICNVLYDSIK